MPEGWAWCRLGELFYHTTGKALKKSNNKGSLRKYITTSNLYWNKFDFTEVREMYFTDDELDKCTIKKGDLVLCNGGDVGRAAIWNFDEDICYQNHVSRLRPKIIGINNKLYLYLLMFYKEQGMLNGKGVGITSLSANDLLSGLFPLPPINEQDQIVIKIENIFSQIDYIDDNKSDLQTVIKQTKSKILDLAIHGKLVPQDPNDEPAEELLKRIATSDNRPYKKFDEEVLFEIPESWSWCYLHTISALLNGDRGENYPSKKDYVECGIPFINAGCLDNGNINYDVANYITEEKYNSLRAGKIQKGDILYCLRGSLGKTGFVITDNKGAISSSLCIFRLTEAIIPKYFLYVLNSNAIKVQQQMVDNGTAQPNLSAKDVSNYAIPIPPLTEQHRIVSKIEELFMLLDHISEQLA